MRGTSPSHVVLLLVVYRAQLVEQSAGCLLALMSPHSWTRAPKNRSDSVEGHFLGFCGQRVLVERLTFLCLLS